MEARIVREELQKCQKAEGVNHYAVCKPLVETYLELLKDAKVSGTRTDRVDKTQPVTRATHKEVRIDEARQAWAKVQISPGDSGLPLQGRRRFWRLVCSPVMSSSATSDIADSSLFSTIQVKGYKIVDEV